MTIPAPARDFTFRNYLAYALYAPLYLTGPILTFNDYISQLRYRPLSIETPRTIRYAVRFLLCLLCMELLVHFIYIGAISKADPDWSSYTPAQLSLLSLYNLYIIWLKLLIPWRMFRLWSLVDGIDPPENMVRCVTNNYSTLSFWRGWHRSYNKWLVRYLWIPLGGADFRTPLSAVRSVAGYLLIFTFVALWHDIKLRLLLWAWLIVLFILPEVIARAVFPKRKFEGRETQYRMLCAAGGVMNCFLMCAGNLVGFAFGLDGLNSILKGIFADYSGKLFWPLSVADTIHQVLTLYLSRPDFLLYSVWRNICRRTGHVRGQAVGVEEGHQSEMLEHHSIAEIPMISASSTCITSKFVKQFARKSPLNY